MVQSPSEMPVPTYVPSPTSPREVGSLFGGCEPAAPPVSGWLFQDADVATAPTAVATQLAPTASEPTMLEYAQVGLLQRQ